MSERVSLYVCLLHIPRKAVVEVTYRLLSLLYLDSRRHYNSNKANILPSGCSADKDYLYGQLLPDVALNLYVYLNWRKDVSMGWLPMMIYDSEGWTQQINIEFLDLFLLKAHNAFSHYLQSNLPILPCAPDIRPRRLYLWSWQQLSLRCLSSQYIFHLVIPTATISYIGPHSNCPWY